MLYADIHCRNSVTTSLHLRQSCVSAMHSFGKRKETGDHYHFGLDWKVNVDLPALCNVVLCSRSFATSIQRDPLVLRFVGCLVVLNRSLYNMQILLLHY